jgi:hypothetical protein
MSEDVTVFKKRLESLSEKLKDCDNKKKGVKRHGTKSRTN